jgi:hypothetical protein
MRTRIYTVLIQISCRKCALEIHMQGQDAGSGYLANKTQREVDAMNERNELLLQTHLVSCALEQRIDDVCTRGLTVPCPACGERTQKDDACSHMVCRNKKCGTTYCYCCGLARIDCDGAGQNYWAEHNVE